MKRNLLFCEKLPPLSPTHNKLYFERLDQKTLFYEVI